MKRTLILLLASFTAIAYAGEGGPFITFLPHNKLVPAFTASGTEHRISLNKQLTRGIFVGSMGGIFPAADVRLGGTVVQCSIASTVYTYLQNANIKFNVETVDFYVDVLFDVPVSDALTLRAGWGHTSHHLADDAVGTGRIPINYARDYYQLFGVYSMPEHSVMMYGGVYWTYSFLINSNIGRKVMPEVGGEAEIFSLDPMTSLYAAADIKLRGEMNFGATQSVQAGVRLRNGNARTMRFAYTYRTGLEDRGQFFDRHTTLQTLGVFFDF